MKHSLMALALLLTAAFAFAETVNVKVKGMVCSFCAQGLDKKFRAEPGVESVKITLKDKNVRIKLKEDAEITDETIRKIVDYAGYNVESIERK